MERSTKGGFGPFGADYGDALATDIFLRYPGQWDDPAWGGYVPGGMYYNVHRWYQRGTGRYSRPDPLGFLDPPLSLTLQPTGDHQDPYLYLHSNPLVGIDPLGLCSLDPTTELCLLFLFGESPIGVRLKEKPRPNSAWRATTRKNKIILYMPCTEFHNHPETLLEEYYHVLRQWNRDRISRISYAREFLRNGYNNNKYEKEAWRWVGDNLQDFKDCLACPPVPPSIGPGGVYPP